MESVRKRIRRDYEPLTVMAGLICVTPLSPATQVYNSGNGEYEPNRTLTPTVIHPSVVASARDGSWANTRANSLLANMTWKVNGVDISTLPEWAGKYSIDLEGWSRGDITINRNLAPGAYVELSFDAVLADTRLGVNVPVHCDPIVLSTVDKAEDDYSMDIGEDQILRYNPFKDKLHLYEYKVAHGIAVGEQEAQNALDENCYLRTVPIQVYKGKDILPTSAYTVRLFQVTGVVSGVPQLTELTVATADEVEVIGTEGIIIDLRLVEKKDYLIRAYVSNIKVAEKQFSVNRVYPKFTIRPTNGTSISAGDTSRYDVAMVDCDGNKVECPESIIKIIWKTDSAALTDVSHGEGGEIVFLLSDTGIGNTYLDDWLDVYCEGSQKGAFSVAEDEDGNVLTDENGNTLIFN